MASYTPSNSFPSLIRQEYEKCKNELENCSYYGAVFALKDSFECILKMYVLCGALKLHREQGQETVLKILCNPQKQPSMGTWLAELLPLCGEELEAEQAWKQSFAIINRLYQKWNIVKWRNDNVGHGALRLANDVEFVNDLKERLVQLENLLQQLEGYAEQIEWGLSENTDPYFVEHDGKLCCLDGVVRGKGVWLCYEDGKRYTEENENISAVLKRYYADLHVSDSVGIRDEIYPAEADAALDAYYKADDYCKPDYMKNWLQGCLEQNEKGIFLLKADRGTGKSAFCYALDELTGGKIRLPGVACRTYFCNRASLRNREDFVMQISRVFYMTADGQEWRSRTIQGMKALDMGTENGKTALCECLATGLEFQKTQGKEKLLLIMDGLDELTYSNEGILAYIPKQEQLPKGVYILLTVRADRNQGSRIDAWLAQTKPTCEKQFDRKAENAELLRLAVSKAANRAAGLKLTEAQVEKTLQVLDYRFGGLKIWECMVEAGMEDRFWQAEAGMAVSNYLELLRHSYGKYAERLNRMFCALAMEENPLDMCTLSILSGDEGLQVGTLAVLYDLKPLYIPEYSKTGGVYLWKYSEEMQELAEQDTKLIEKLAVSWKDMLEGLSELQPWQRGGYLYMATHIYHIWEKAFGNLEGLSEAFQIENLKRMAMLIGNSEQYIEAIWHGHALEKIVEAEEKNGRAESKICFLALVEQLHPFVSLRQHRRAQEMIGRIEAVLSQKENVWKTQEDMLPMLWQYYGDSMIVYAELLDMERAERQYQKALQLPVIPDCALSLRISHMNMIKQDKPERCLEECCEIERLLPQEAVMSRTNIYHTMAVASEQLARKGKQEYVDKEREHLEKGILLLQPIPIRPECFPANRTLALLLEGLARWYATWEGNLTAALGYMEQVRQILIFHSQFQNLVPPEDVFRVYLFLVKWYGERKDVGDIETARKVFTAMEGMYNNLTVELPPPLYHFIQNDMELLREELFPVMGS